MPRGKQALRRSTSAKEYFIGHMGPDKDSDEDFDPEGDAQPDSEADEPLSDEERPKKKQRQAKARKKTPVRKASRRLPFKQSTSEQNKHKSEFIHGMTRPEPLQKQPFAMERDKAASSAQASKLSSKPVRSSPKPKSPKSPKPKSPKPKSPKSPQPKSPTSPKPTQSKSPTFKSHKTSKPLPMSPTLPEPSSKPPKSSKTSMMPRKPPGKPIASSEKRTNPSKSLKNVPVAEKCDKGEYSASMLGADDGASTPLKSTRKKDIGKADNAGVPMATSNGLVLGTKRKRDSDLLSLGTVTSPPTEDGECPSELMYMEERFLGNRTSKTSGERQAIIEAHAHIVQQVPPVPRKLYKSWTDVQQVVEAYQRTTGFVYRVRDSQSTDVFNL
ncbi:hypothetical protein PHYBOEH_004785 [Phytophthora boehmeriae]|uniref:Uncharacterized protein n=1 Tax=Phytophthora boehmeriae TaxID=109152 RepID=A0A8T1WMV1_9STRA|nr:hypothetical protein PHYBOEH_004785 [Phytophthora boehmeriae]